MYQASQTVQITEVNSAPSSLVVHEMRPDGTPLCNQTLREWRGKKMKFTPRGPGIVNCAN